MSTDRVQAATVIEDEDLKSLSETPQYYKIMGFPLTEEYFCRLATRICGEDVDDVLQAYEVVLGEALQMGFDVPPGKTDMLEEGVGEAPSVLMFAVFSDHHPACSEAHPERLGVAIGWLEENGLPEIGQISLIPALVER